MRDPSSPTPKGNAVIIELQDGKYIVRVVENGELVERDFKLEAHAHSWAQGQRLRLGLIDTLI